MSNITFALFTYNEEKRISFAIKNLIKYGEVVIMDGGSTDKTKEIAEAMNKISLAEFESKFNGPLMMEKNIYPQIWDEGNDALQYLTDNFEKLKEFYNLANTNMQAMIIFIN